MSDSPRVGFVGTGRMATALAGGLVSSGFCPAASIVGSDVVPAAAEAFAESTGGAVVESNAEVAARSDVIVLAVKPQQMSEVLAGLAPAITDDHLVVSIAAGITLQTLAAGLGDPPLQPAARGHVYLTTRPDASHPVDRRSPAIRDRHLRIYSRPESGGLIVGMYGPDAVQHDMAALPDDFDMSSLTVRADDLHVALLIDATKRRFPWIDERTPMTITRGIMTFSPDGKPFCGQRPDFDGLFHCSGFCGHGIVQSPAIGVIMADLVLDGSTGYDMEALQDDRDFGAQLGQCAPER